MSKRLMILCSFLALALLIGCAGGSNPLDPETVSQNPALQNQSSHGVSNTHLWGFYDVAINLETREVEVVPNRHMMFTANVTEFVNGAASGLGFGIVDTIMDPDNEFVDVDINVAITHPFPGLPQYHGFDVRGVFMGDGSESMSYNGDLTYGVNGVDQFLLDDPLNDDGGGPDGYTRWFNFTEFSEGGLPLLQYTHGKMASPGYEPSATLNPYKYFADGLGIKEDLFDWLEIHADQNGQFSSGAVNERNYYLRFPIQEPGVIFAYAILANWTDVDVDRINATEAVACSVTITDNIYFSDPLNWGGDMILDISLFNWGLQPSTIYVESPLLLSHYQLSPAEMVPTDGNDLYSTWHTEIPAENVTGHGPEEFWVVAEYEVETYANDFGSPNLADDDYLAAFFRETIWVHQECGSSPDPDIDGLNGETQALAVNRAYTGWIIDGDLFEPGCEVYVEDDGTFIAQATNVETLSQTQLQFDIDLTDVAPGIYDIKVENGCVAPGITVVDDMLKVLRHIYPVGDPNIDVVTGYAIPQDITCDPDNDQVAIAYKEHGQWSGWSSDYSVEETHDTRFSPFSGRNVYIHAWDCQPHIIWYVYDSAPFYTGQYMNWTWTDFTGFESTYAYWQPEDGNKFYDIANVQNTNQLWGIFNWWSYSVAFIGSNGDGNMSYYHSFIGDPAFYGGEGDIGVIVDNIIAIDMDEFTGTYEMYVLENLPDTDTAVAELWTVAYDPVFLGSFGEDLLYEALDITVDSDFNVYILENNADGYPQVWAWNQDHELVGWSETMDSDVVSGDALRMDCFLADIPDQVQLLHSNGVTKLAMSPE